MRNARRAISRYDRLLVLVPGTDGTGSEIDQVGWLVELSEALAEATPEVEVEHRWPARERCEFNRPSPDIAVAAICWARSPRVPQALAAARRWIQTFGRETQQPEVTVVLGSWYLPITSYYSGTLRGVRSQSSWAQPSVGQVGLDDLVSILGSDTPQRLGDPISFESADARQFLDRYMQRVEALRERAARWNSLIPVLPHPEEPDALPAIDPTDLMRFIDAARPVRATPTMKQRAEFAAIQGTFETKWFALKGGGGLR